MHESKNLGTAENRSVDLDAEFRKSIANIKSRVRAVLRRILSLRLLRNSVKNAA